MFIYKNNNKKIRLIYYQCLWLNIPKSALYCNVIFPYTMHTCVHHLTYISKYIIKHIWLCVTSCYHVTKIPRLESRNNNQTTEEGQEMWLKASEKVRSCTILYCNILLMVSFAKITHCKCEGIHICNVLKYDNFPSGMTLQYFQAAIINICIITMYQMTMWQREWRLW